MCVYFIDMEKAYDRVGKNKLFDVLRDYGVNEKLVSMVDRVYSNTVVTGRCRGDSGVSKAMMSPVPSLVYFVC